MLVGHHSDASCAALRQRRFRSARGAHKGSSENEESGRWGGWRNTLRYFALQAETERAIGLSDRPCSCYGCASLTTPGRPATGVALEARAVADQREVAAFAAGFAFVAPGLGFGPPLGRRRSRACASVATRAGIARTNGRFCCSSCSVGESLCSGSALSAADPEISARVSRPPKAVTFTPTPALSREGGGRDPAREEVVATSCQNRKLVRARARQPLGDVPGRGRAAPGLPSSTPLPSASKPPSVGSTWARSKRSR